MCLTLRSVTVMNRLVGSVSDTAVRYSDEQTGSVSDTAVRYSDEQTGW